MWRLPREAVVVLARLPQVLPQGRPQRFALLAEPLRPGSRPEGGVWGKLVEQLPGLLPSPSPQQVPRQPKQLDHFL